MVKTIRPPRWSSAPKARIETHRPRRLARLISIRACRNSIGGVGVPVEQQRRLLEHARDVGDEAARDIAVDHAVVEARRRPSSRSAARTSPSTTHGFCLIVPSATIATSPGLRIGVPVSMPYEPMFVIVIVPSGHLGGLGLAVARRDRQLLERLRELEQATATARP